MNAIILHGTGCNLGSFWQPSIKNYLELKGYEGWVPQLPDADHPDLRTWLPLIVDNGKFTKDTILIGHSAGCPLLLSILQHIHIQIHKAILVAGYARPLGHTESNVILQQRYLWNKIKNNARDMIIINSDNDPWGCNHTEGLFIWKHTGGTLILREGEGHMGSDSFKQPYKRFELLEKLIDMKYSRVWAARTVG